jgi:hypothetical protein
MCVAILSNRNTAHVNIGGVTHLKHRLSMILIVLIVLTVLTLVTACTKQKPQPVAESAKKEIVLAIRGEPEAGFDQVYWSLVMSIN